MNAARRHRSEQRRLLGLRHAVHYAWSQEPEGRLPRAEAKEKPVTDQNKETWAADLHTKETAKPADKTTEPKRVSPEKADLGNTTQTSPPAAEPHQGLVKADLEK